MYRLLKCTKDTYLQNKWVNGVRATDASTGQAGTLDVFKLYQESILSGGVSSGIELSRGLIQFDLNPLRELTGSILNINTSSFKCYVSLKSIYGGQICPSNYVLSLFPLSKSWEEGRGSDVIVYRDIDAANFLTSSVSSGVSLWNVSGANGGGLLNSSNIDYITSGNLLDGNGIVSFEKKQTFERGDEDLLIDVSNIVSATLAGLIPDYGFRLSFTASQEIDSTTRFVKRFATRHVSERSLRPKLIVKYNDSIIDDNRSLFFDVSNSLYFYNHYRGTTRNFFSGAAEITGSNSLVLTLASSKSVIQTTTSFQSNFNTVITYSVATTQYFSTSFSASQYSIGNQFQNGVYYSNFTIPTETDSTLKTFIDSSSSIGFQQYWQSIDKTITYATGNFLKIKRAIGNNEISFNNNYIVNIINLKSFYNSNEKIRLKVFIQNYDAENTNSRLPIKSTSLVFKNMYYRIVDAFQRKEIIPFDTDYNSTKLSSDGSGMYFDLFIEDLDINQVYEIEFLIQENSKDYYINNQGFRFKVVN